MPVTYRSALLALGLLALFVRFSLFGFFCSVVFGGLLPREQAHEALAATGVLLVRLGFLQMLLADGELSRMEVSNLLVVAEALGLDPEDAILLLADMVKSEDELTINFND